MTRMKLWAIQIFAAMCCMSGNPAQGSAPFEDEVSSIEVRYSNGSAISINCAKGECVVEIGISGNKYVFASDVLKGSADPNTKPVLFSENNLPESFSFQVRLSCDEPPFAGRDSGPCFGNYLVSSGAIQDTHKYFKIGRDEIPVH